MDVNEKIMELEEAVGCPVAPGLYKGKAQKYIEFSVQEYPDLFADDEDMTEETLVRINYVCPYDFDYGEAKKKIKKAMKDRGFTFDSFEEVTNVDPASGEKESRSLIFEFKFLQEE